MRLFTGDILTFVCDSVIGPSYLVDADTSNSIGIVNNVESYAYQAPISENIVSIEFNNATGSDVFNLKIYKNGIVIHLIPVLANGETATYSGGVWSLPLIPSTSGLTDAELRATPVAISGTVTANTGLSQPLTDVQLRSTPVPISGTVSVSGGGDATAANQVITNTEIGDVVESAPVTDTASSGLNGRLQRIAQRITSLIAALGSPFQAGGSIGNTSFEATQVTGSNLHTVVDSGVITTITNVVHIDDNGGSVTVDGPLTDAQLRSTPVPISGTVISTPSGTQTVSEKNVIDTNNSSVAPLLAGATFTGTATEVLSYRNVVVSAYSDVASSVDGMNLQFSSDGTNWDFNEDYTLDANLGESWAVPVMARYFRVLFVNGGSNQTVFRLQTILSADDLTGMVANLETRVSDTNQAVVTKSVLSARRPGGTYENIGATGGGNLKVAIEEFDTSLPAGTNNIGDVDIVSSVLPTGASTEATLSTLNGKVPSGLTVTGGKLQVELPPGGGGLTDTELRATPVPISGTVSVSGGGDATAANQVITNTEIGDVIEVAPGTDTASSGLNGRLQRIAQRITSLIALLPSALTGSGNFKTAIQESLPSGTNNIGDVDVLTLPAITGAVTANAGTNLNTSALALDATLTGGNLKAVIRGGSKGVVSAADVTSTNQSADRNALDVQIRTSAGAVVDSFGGGTEYTEGDIDPSITGTAMLMEAGLSTLQPVQGTLADGLLVNLGANNDVVVSATNLDTRDLAFATDKVDVSGSTGVGVTGPLTDTQLRATAVPVSFASASVLFRGRAATFNTPGRAGTTGQKILSLHNATGSPVVVNISRITVDLTQTVVKAITVAPPIIRVWKVTVLPTNGTVLAKTKIGGTSTSDASVTVRGDASADATGSASTLTATLPAGTFISQEYASRSITAAGFEMMDRAEFDYAQQIELKALEGIVVFIDYVLATQNPTTDRWIVGIEWTEQ